MKRLLAWLICMAAAGAGVPASAGTWYAWNNSPANGPGTAWSNAFHTVDAAIAAAARGDEVWVAAGVHTPAGPNGFVMKRGVDLYGGFAGSETFRTQRVWRTHLTVLSGDRDRNDPTNANGIVESAAATDSPLVGSNSHHVLYWSVTTYASNIVDGFVITAGAGTNGSHGGGVRILNNEWLTLRNCTISGNRAGPGTDSADATPGRPGGHGGGLYVEGGHCLVEGCILRGNRSGSGGISAGGGAGGTAGEGGGICLQTRYTTVRNCLVVGNRTGTGGFGSPWGANGTGGGIRSIHDLTLRNCTITENTAEWGGGLSTAGEGSVRNNVIYGNTGDFSTNWHNEAGSTVWGDHNCITNDPLFIDAAADRYQLSEYSPCLDAGTNETWMATEVDLDGEPRIVNGTVDAGSFELRTPFVIIAPHLGIHSENYSASPVLGVNRGEVVGTMWWTNDLTGSSKTFPATPAWSNSIPIDFGENTITVFGSNSIGTVVSDTLVIYRQYYYDPTKDRYVSPEGANRHPYTTWATAASSIQDAVDAANPGNTVWVSNGVYNTGGSTNSEYALTNRVCITNAITVRSANGPSVTTITGAGPLGPTAIRCVYMVDGAVVSGFTLSNGHTHVSENIYFNQSGAGAFLDGGGVLEDCVVVGNQGDGYGTVFFWYGGTAEGCEIRGNRAGGGSGVTCWYGGTVTNCAIVGNETLGNGGGVVCSYGGVVRNCTIAGNEALDGGGGVVCSYGGVVHNCTIYSNETSGVGGSGGGVFCDHGGDIRNCGIWGNRVSGTGGGGLSCEVGGSVWNCTIAGNEATGAGGLGGGVYCKNGGVLGNCIVYENTSAAGGANWFTEGSGYSFAACCTTPALTNAATDCIAEDPHFVDPGTGDLRLAFSSPCVEAGTNDAWMSTAVDLGGLPRISGDHVDMGAHEFPDPARVDITTSNNTFCGDSGAYAVQGTAITTMSGNLSWTNAQLGAHGSLAVTSPWVVVMPLTLGRNDITVSGRNAAGYVVSDSVTLWRYEYRANHYVSPEGANVYPYSDWEIAAHTIQDAVDAAAAGDTVFVSNGVYAAGGCVTPGYTLINRVAITNAITVKSVNGPDVTIITGAGPVGPAAARCVYLKSGAVVSGFTLSNGHTRVSGDLFLDCSGGGAYLDHGGALVNCVVKEGKAKVRAGGVLCSSGGTVDGCLVWRNEADSCAGAACWYGGTLRSCTIAGNTSTRHGGGVSCENGGTVRNCIVYENTAGTGGVNWYVGGSAHSFEYCCTTPLPTVNATDCISDDPEFIRTGRGDLRLPDTSPCIDTGTNEAWMAVATDIMGRPRIVNATVDMGAHEWTPWINATTSGSGTIDPPGQTWVLPGENLSYSIIPGPSYVIEDVLVDGGSVGAVSAYTFTNVTEYHTIRAVFFVDVPVMHVAKTGSHAWPYAAWRTAATNIQTAVDIIPSGGLVLVSNGVYDAGTRGTPGGTSANRLVVTRDVTIRSANGPAVTVIAGEPASGGGCGDGAIRCVYMTAGALEGFTLTNGHTKASGDMYKDRAGGGVQARSTAVLRNCILTGNTANHGGGGVCYGTLYNCLLTRNTAGLGGGALSAVLNNCTLSANVADEGGGANSCDLTNSIAHGNTAGSGPNWASCNLSYCCTVPEGGVACVTDDPEFTHGAYTLSTKSPCIDVGLNGTWMDDATDLAGRPRVLDGDAANKITVDIGCYEYLNRDADSDGDTMTDGFEDDYDLDPADPADASDNPDDDPHNNLQEFVALTDPSDPTDYFRITAISNNSPPAICFDSSRDRRYTLSGCSNLTEGVWHTIPGAGPRAGAGGRDVLEDMNEPPFGPFYRLRVELPK